MIYLKTFKSDTTTNFKVGSTTSVNFETSDDGQPSIQTPRPTRQCDAQLGEVKKTNEKIIILKILFHCTCVKSTMEI